MSLEFWLPSNLKTSDFALPMIMCKKLSMAHHRNIPFVVTRRMGLATTVLVVLTTVPAVSHAVTWSAASPGNLLTGSNWSGGTAPNGINAIAQFTTQPTNAGNFTLNSTMTLGTLLYSNSQSRSITGTGTLNLAVSSGTPEISVTGGDLTVATSVSGSAGLNITGSGTLTFSGSNSYTGTTTISGGTLSGNTIANQGFTSAFGQGNLAISNGATLEYAGPGPGETNRTISLGNGGGTISMTNELTAKGVFSGSGGLTKTGPGALQLDGSGTNTYAGSTTINQGTLRIATSNERIPDGSAVTVASGAVLDVNSFNETIGSLAGAGSVTFGNGDLTTGGNNASTTFSGVISGGGSIIKNGTGTLTLSGSNSNAGTTTINGGTLSGNSIANFGSDSAFGRGSFKINNGATLQYTGATASTDRTVVLNAGGGVIDVTNAAATLTTNNGISGAGGLTKTGSGTLTLSSTNSYSGGTTISGGTLQFGRTNYMPSSGGVSVNPSSTLAINAGGTGQWTNGTSGGGTIGGLTAGTGGQGTANQITWNSGSALGIDTTNAPNDTLTFSGVIGNFRSGTGTTRNDVGLTKLGTGSLILAGANTYTGATNINAGALTLGASERITDTSAVIINSGASLNLNNFNETIGSLAGGGMVNLVSGNLTAGGNHTSTIFTGNISGSGGLTKTGDGVFTLINNSYTGKTSVSGGTLSGNNIADQGLDSSYGRGSFAISGFY
jgi:autotransporter-associated beta strand protein